MFMLFCSNLVFVVSQRLSSQDTTVVVEEEEDESPVISMESIQRVLSFSQSFSRPSSQISASSASGALASSFLFLTILAVSFLLLIF